MRVATAADAPAIAELHLASHLVAYRGLVPDHLLDQGGLGARTAHWAHAIAGGVTVFLLEDGGRLAAFCSVEPTRDPDDDPARVAFIESLHARPELRGRGYGTILLRRALAWARASGREELTLHVVDGNTPAQRFYEGHGFAADGWCSEYATSVTRRYRISLPTP